MCFCTLLGLDKGERKSSGLKAWVVGMGTAWRSGHDAIAAKHPPPSRFDQPWLSTSYYRLPVPSSTSYDQPKRRGRRERGSATFKVVTEYLAVSDQPRTPASADRVVRQQPLPRRTPPKPRLIFFMDAFPSFLSAVAHLVLGPMISF